MLNEKYKIYKSGTDIRGIGSEGVEGEHINLGDEVVERMAAGFALWAAEKTGKAAHRMKIAVGRDVRISGGRIAAAVIRTLKKAGVKVYDCGLSSTPSMFMTTVDFGCDASVMITASHHPFNRNGLKFFTRAGGLDGEDITAILEHAQNGDTPPEKEGTVEKIDFMELYSAHLRDIIKLGVNAENYEKPLEYLFPVDDLEHGKE